jgi:hypothetical protein
MGLKDRLRTGGAVSGRASTTVIDYDDFNQDASDPEWQDSLAAAREHVAGDSRGAAVIDVDEFIADSKDADWQHSLAAAREHVAQLERDGRNIV